MSDYDDNAAMHLAMPCPPRYSHLPVPALAALLMMGLLLLAGADRAAAQTPTITLDPAVRFQHFNGFGVGSIFYQGHLARGVPPNYVSYTYDVLFRQLDHKYLMFWLRPNEDVNDNADPNLVNWSGFTFGDAQQDYVTVINAAKARDTNLVLIATVYTPPAWLKSNRSLYNGGTLDTSVPNAYAEFAEFVFANLHWFKQRGVSVSILSWMNEPDYTLSHEDADFTAAQARDVHRYCVPQLQALIASTQNTAGLQMPQIMGPQTLSVSTAASYVDTLKANATAWTNTHVIATHQYGGSSVANFSNLVQKSAGKPVLMSEWHSANNDDLDPEDVEVVEQGRAICTALNGGVNGYLWFEANHPGNGFAGLIHLPWWSTTGPNVMKTYHSWRQWLSLTPQGANRISARADNLPASIEGSVAFHSPGLTNAVLHLVKSGTNLDTIQLRVAGKLIKRVEQWRTSATLGYAKVLDATHAAGTNQFVTPLAGNQLSSYRLHFAPDPLLGTNGPLACWRFDDGSGSVADDYTGNGFSGSLQNAPAWTNTHAGRRHLQFNGVNQYVQVAGLPDLTNQFTIALWARSATATWNTYGMLASRRPQFVLHPWAGSSKTLSLIVYDPAGNERRADFNLVDIDGFDLTEWHHYAGTFEAASGLAKLYVDGRLRATTSSGPSALKSDTGPLQIAWDDGFAGRYFAGGLDEVRLSDRALTAAELAPLAAGFDDDQDGLPDDFERRLIEFSNTDAVRTLADVTPQGDFDGDGASNRDEFIAGTDAASAADRFQITAIRQGAAPGNVEVTVHGKAGRRYSCETLATLAPGGWQVVQQVGPLAADQPVVFTHNLAPAAASFYRVRVE